MQRIVVDSSAVISWVAGEPGHHTLRSFLNSGAWQRVITPITLFEIKFVLMRKGFTEGDLAAGLAFTKAVCELLEVSEAIALRAAEIRLKYLRAAKASVSMADAIAIALAESMNAPLLSLDKELRQVTEARILP